MLAVVENVAVGVGVAVGGLRRHVASETSKQRQARKLWADAGKDIERL